MAEIKTVLTDERISQIAATFDKVTCPGFTNYEFARAIEAAVLSANAGKVDAETYLRERYGAYKGHFAWRELEDAFNAGRASPTQQAIDAGKV